MAYIIRSSEQNASRGNEMETRALLHMLSFREEYDDINCFAIDFFNDVTGMDNMALRLYDVQSKAARSGPKEIGPELVTLFKNYVSDFHEFFVEEALFLGSIRNNLLIGEPLSEFRFSDLTEEAQADVRSSFEAACHDKSYIDEADITRENIEGFLGEVVFIVSKETVEEYIAPLIRTADALIPTSDEMRAIFNQIKKAQGGIKTQSKVEGLSVNHPSDVYRYNRVLKREDIELLVINMLINKNPMEAGVPVSFIPIYNKLVEVSPEDAEDRLEECQDDLARQMFAASEAPAFWKLLSEVVTAIKNNPDASVDDIFLAITPEALAGCKFLHALSAQYFIAIVKDGLGR